MEMIQQDITIGMVELLDDLMIRATNLHFEMTLEEKPTLYFEFNGVTELALDVLVLPLVTLMYLGAGLYCPRY